MTPTFSNASDIRDRVHLVLGGHFPSVHSRSPSLAQPHQTEKAAIDGGLTFDREDTSYRRQPPSEVLFFVIPMRFPMPFRWLRGHAATYTEQSFDGYRVRGRGRLRNSLSDVSAGVCARSPVVRRLQPALPPCPVSPRVTRWSEAAADIRDTRKLVLDEGLSVQPTSRNLLTASLAVAMVKNDDQGSVRLKKRGGHNKARDDVAAALVLAAGAFMQGGSRHGLASLCGLR